ncbi:MAG: Hsp20/alpha crystallin family protein [Actinomycetota bacterium]|nr:Hsp20/alpha crystallin family protein [Actinomycetota bacterium]
MTLIRWEPVRELSTIQNEMNRLFNTFFDPSAQAAGGAAGSQGARRWMPAMDLVETGEAFVLHADLPGLSEQDVNIELEDGVLTISGERRAEHADHKEGYYRLERAWGSFHRSLTLPDGVDPEGVQASFDRGVLEVRIPKPQARKPRKVSISVGGDATPASGGAEPNTIEGSEAPNGAAPELAPNAA